jgi:SAM-dependent methyltransferase
MFSRWLRAFGIDWACFYTALKGLKRFWSDYRQIKELNSAADKRWILQANYPCLLDFYGQSGVASGHYFYQDLLVAQKIFERRPGKHVDVGSRIDGFVAHVASFREIEVFDIRTLASPAPNIVFHHCDLLNISSHFHEYCDSLSCLHVLEHVGLGRYGDTIDIGGHVKALRNLAKILRPGGTLYLSAPFGVERIEYNAHRVFHLGTLLNLIERSLEIVEFSMVDDAGALNVNADLQCTVERSGFYRFALAIFELRRPR